MSNNIRRFAIMLSARLRGEPSKPTPITVTVPDHSHKPKGTFRCTTCGETWDGSQLVRSVYDNVWMCGDYFCEGAVRRISKEPFSESEINVSETEIREE